MNRLSEITFSDEKRNRFYKEIWGSSTFEAEVLKKKSGCEFKIQEDNIADTIMNIFCIENKSQFLSKYAQAISGDGKEDCKISNLRSSSLLSLLFFYNVTKENPLILQLNDEICTFEYSLFEFKNKVIRKPSNMDVVLLGKSGKKKVILFLESKFGEYYFDVTNLEVPYFVPYSYYKQYQSLYESIERELDVKSDFQEKRRNKSKVFELYPIKNAHYIGGIKQMISHYIGVQNFAKGDFVTTSNSRLDSILTYLGSPFSEQKILDELKDNAEIYLAEIVFDKGIKNLELGKGNNYFSDYEELHNKLSKILVNDNKNPKVHIVQNLLKYSDYDKWNHKIEDKIKQYYFE